MSAIISKFVICQACGRQHDVAVSTCENCGWTPPVAPVEPVAPAEGADTAVTDTAA